MRKNERGGDDGWREGGRKTERICTRETKLEAITRGDTPLLLHLTSLHRLVWHLRVSLPHKLYHFILKNNIASDAQTKTRKKHNLILPLIKKKTD